MKNLLYIKGNPKLQIQNKFSFDIYMKMEKSSDNSWKCVFKTLSAEYHFVESNSMSFDIFCCVMTLWLTQNYDFRFLLNIYYCYCLSPIA